MLSDWIRRLKGRRPAAQDDEILAALRPAATAAPSHPAGSELDGAGFGSGGSGLDPHLLAQLRALQDWASNGGNEDWLPLEPPEPPEPPEAPERPEAPDHGRHGAPGETAPRLAHPETDSFRPIIRRRAGVPPARVPAGKAAARRGRLGLPRAAMAPLLVLALAGAWLRAPSSLRTAGPAAASGATLSAATAMAGETIAAQPAPRRPYHRPLTLREPAAARDGANRGEDGSQAAPAAQPGPSPDAAARTTVAPGARGTQPRTEPRRPADLSGRWAIQDVVRSTTYPPYRQLHMTYRVALRQVGERVSGDGEKWEENGSPLPRSRRTPIRLAGRVVGREVRVRFTEGGAWRDSEGTFRWHLSPGGNRFAGTFASDAANARGSSAAARLTDDPPSHPVARVYAFMRHLVRGIRTRLKAAAHPSP